MNSYVAGEYMKRQFFSMNDLCSLRNDKRDFEEQKHILQWVEKFRPILHEYPNMSRAYIFVFKPEGMRTKQFVDDTEWNSWNEQDPNAFITCFEKSPLGFGANAVVLSWRNKGP
jgi:hypothetical protein